MDDLLVQAVERAWDDGITVVTAAGNLGPAPGSITAAVSYTHLDVYKRQVCDRLAGSFCRTWLCTAVWHVKKDVK